MKIIKLLTTLLLLGFLSCEQDEIFEVEGVWFLSSIEIIDWDLLLVQSHSYTQNDIDNFTISQRETIIDSIGAVYENMIYNEYWAYKFGNNGAYYYSDWSNYDEEQGVIWYDEPSETWRWTESSHKVVIEIKQDDKWISGKTFIKYKEMLVYNHLSEEGDTILIMYHEKNE